MHAAYLDEGSVFDIVTYTPRLSSFAVLTPVAQTPLAGPKGVSDTATAATAAAGK